MKIQEAIDRAFLIRPDSFPVEEKVAWLNEFDGQLYIETILTHENNEGISFSKYGPSDLDAELLIPFPHDKVYPSYIKMKVSESYGETEEYNNDAHIFNKHLEEFKAYWNRTYRSFPPCGVKKPCPGGIYYVYPCDDPLKVEE